MTMKAGIIGAPPFSGLDREFYLFLAEHGAGEATALAGALLSNRVTAGDTCVSIPDIAGKSAAEALGDEFAGTPAPELLMLPGGAEWLKALRKSEAVGAPGEMKPLVLDDAGRLYLYRYWDYEMRLAGDINARLALDPPAVDRPVLKDGLGRYFPGGGKCDWQRVAAARALTGRFTVISGGPGTGKTSTVARIIALLLEQARAAKREYAIALAAPTGKAAARLRESVESAFAPGGALEICDGAIRGAFPREAYTIHRLLRPRPGTPYFRHDRDNPLPHDAVIVDESSMVDLALMAKLLTAIRPEARVILLGDRDQLSSVEAGSVLGDICGGAGSGSPGFSAEFAAEVKELSGDLIPKDKIAHGTLSVRDSIVLLEKSYRFNEGIAAFSADINAGRSAEAARALSAGGYETVELRGARGHGELQELIAGLVREGRWDRLADAAPAEALGRFFEFMLLCPLRRGRRGSETVSAAVERHLAVTGAIRPGSRWYSGMPVMVTSNDYGLGLFNGDIGIVREDDDGRSHRAFFPGGEAGAARQVAVQRLPEHETVYALTVHKSQGSEFSRVAIVLPDADSPVLSRQLLYTAVTRARDGVEIWGDTDILRKMIERPITRRSGLRDRLWGP